MSVFEWVDESEAESALSNLSINNTQWVLFGYEGAKVKLVATGAGNLFDVAPLLSDAEIQYMVLTIEVKDQGEAELFSTSKTIFITWVGTECKPMAKARSSQHRLPLYNYVLKHLQLGAELQVLEPEYLTEANILAKLRGTHVEHDATLPAASSSSSGGSGSQPSTPEAARRSCSSPQTTNRHVMKSSSLSAQQYATYKGASDVLTEVDFADPEEAHARLEDVRRDGTATNWLVFGHEGSKNTLTVLGSGGGGWDETVGFFVDDAIVYCVLGVEVADEAGGSEYKTTKYVFISWVGPNVKPLAKARSSQVRVALYKHTKLFMQLAGEIQLLDRADLSETTIKQKLNSNF